MVAVLSFNSELSSGESRAGLAHVEVGAVIEFVRSLDPLLVEAVADVDLTLVALAVSRTPSERLACATRAAKALAGFRKVVTYDSDVVGEPMGEPG
jgi:hypothetical protein